MVGSLFEQKAAADTAAAQSMEEAARAKAEAERERKAAARKPLLASVVSS